MCGIAGFVNWSGGPASLSLLVAMTDRLAHRGPDGEGHRVSGNAAIGHRRLSIIDVGSGAQPMGNEDGTVWVSFNGEIYNYRDLRDTLVSHGHVFRTQSDTETIVHGYEQWGASGLLSRLRGIFAFAILDERSQSLLLARDHFGVKPVVYYADDTRFAFGSEIKALTVDPSIPRTIDNVAVADYFDYGYIPAPATIYKGFRKLLPGHFLAVDLRRAASHVQQQYWRLVYEEQAVRERTALARLDELMSESVRLQLVSDVPLGALLSGGIDSSAIVSMMAQHSSEKVKTFSIGFDEERFSEAAFARQVADHIGTEHHEHIVRADVAALLPRLVYHFDEPFADASAVPTHYVCEMARRNVTVCLSGDGGDEMFAGYDRYAQCARQGALDLLPRPLRSAVFGPLAAVYGRDWPGAGLVRGAASTPPERFVNYLRAQYGAVNGRMMFSEAMKARVPRDRIDFAYLQQAFDPAVKNSLNSWLDVDVRTYLPNDILTKVDITSMMNSLELRVPLLDHKLAEYVATLPPDLKLKGRVGKYALKEVVRRRLPPAVLDRPKMGFGVPMREWMSKPLREFTHHYLLDSSRASGVLDRATMQRMVEDNERHLYKSRSAGKLWWALWFEIWHQDVYRA